MLCPFAVKVGKYSQHHGWGTLRLPRRRSNKERQEIEGGRQPQRADDVPKDGIVLVDVGVHHNWMVQQWPVYLPQTLLQSWGFAAMGFAVGGVLGAKLAAPGRPAVAVCGDGGFLMTSNAVATAVEYGIPATWVVWNNYGYVSIRDLQRGAFGKRPRRCSVANRPASRSRRTTRCSRGPAAPRASG